MSSRLRKFPLPVLALAALAVIAVACGPTAVVSPAASPTPAPPTNPPTTLPTATPTLTPATPTPTETPPAAQLLIEVTSEGGFINPQASIARPAEVVVDLDGHIYTPQADLTGDTEPLVLPISVRDVGPAGAEQILAAIRAAHLDTEGGDGGVVADTGSSVFTVVIDGQEVVNRFAAGGPPGPGGPGAPGGSPAASDNKQAAFDLLSKLTDPTETWGAQDVQATTYEPLAYRVWSAPASSENGTSVVDWPLSEPLATFGSPATPDYGVTDLRSGVVFGDEVATFADAIKNSQSTTLFRSGDGTFMLWVRALLPDELG